MTKKTLGPETPEQKAERMRVIEQLRELQIRIEREDKLKVDAEKRAANQHQSAVIAYSQATGAAQRQSENAGPGHCRTNPPSPPPPSAIIEIRLRIIGPDSATQTQ